MRTLIFAAATIAMTCPTFAGEYFIVREGDDKACRIVETRPAEETVVIVGDRAYVTREEAEKEIEVVCKDD